jgi:hypothetical protein
MLIEDIFTYNKVLQVKLFFNALAECKISQYKIGRVKGTLD